MLIPNPVLNVWNFDPKLYFWANFAPKSQSCPFCLKNGAHSISRKLISNPDLDFWNFDPKIHFWTNVCPQIQSCPFCLKIDTHGISKMLILISTLVLGISNPYFIFGQKCLVWLKIGTQSVSTMLILIPTLLFSVSNPKSFFGQIWAKNSKLFILTKNWHTWYIEDADSFSDHIFLNSQP